MMATAEGVRQIVVFAMCGEEYALPIDQVQEIVEYQRPRSVAADADWIRGVISLRGKIIPVCDLTSRLRLAGRGEVAGKIVVAEGGGATIGIVVDEVEEVLTITDEQIDPLVVAGSDLAHAIVKVGDRLILLLDSTPALADTADVVLD